MMLLKVEKSMLKTVVTFAVLSTAALAQSEGPLSSSTKLVYGALKGQVLAGAAKMPEENYSFKPTDDVRTFGQLVGHIADASYMFCALALGEKNPAPGIEKSKTTKAELVAALKEATAYCDKAYAAMNDGSTAVEMADSMFGKMPKLTLLSINSAHSYEHYGNMSTYMRIKGVVPPSSEPRPGQAAPAKNDASKPPMQRK